MGRKKRRSDAEQQRIFCYYCDRNFGSEQTLLSHQKEKHLRCPTCSKRMISVSGLVIHSQQVHNVTVSTVPNAVPGRTSVAIDVVGMNGIPPSYYIQQSQSAPKVPRLNGVSTAGAYPAQPYYAQTAQTSYANGYAGGQPYANAYVGAQAYGNANAYNHAQPYGNGYGTAYATGYGYAPQPHTRYYPYAHAPAARATYPQYPSSSQPVAQPVTQPVAQPPIAQPLLSVVPTVTPVAPVSVALATPASTPAPRSLAAPSIATSAPPTTHSVTKASVSTVTSTPKPDKKSQQVKVVFDELHVSMEELRAKLPRYKLEG